MDTGKRVNGLFFFSFVSKKKWHHAGKGVTPLPKPSERAKMHKTGARAGNLFLFWFFLDHIHTHKQTMSISITEKRRVALAYDGSEDARKLFDWSIQNIIKPESDHLILLSAVPPGESSMASSGGLSLGSLGGGTSSSSDKSGSLPMLSTSPSRISSAIEQAGKYPQGKTARERLEDMVAHLRTLHISSEEHILWGDPKILIPRFTQQQQVDLLIVGSRGLGTVKSVFVGSVSNRCIHECPCPVLVVRNTTI